MFRAYDSERDRLVAIKVFRLDLTPEQTVALVRELNHVVAAGISHPNIAAPIAADTDDGAAYLVQEFAVGDSLDVVLRERGAMSLEEAVPLVVSLAGAIDHAASRGVRHGALHMRDIIVESNGGVRMTGFGIVDALAKISAKLPTRPQYSSPDGASDVYSLAAIAFEMLTGKRVSPGNLDEMERAHGSDLRNAFGVALAPGAQSAVNTAGAFADRLRRAAHISAPAPAPTPAVVAPVIVDVSAPVPDPNPIDDLPIRSEPLLIRSEPLPDLPADTPVAQPDWHEEFKEPAAAPPRSQWPVLAIFLVSAALAAVVVLIFLRGSPRQPGNAPAAGVAETTVEVPPAKTETAPIAPQPARESQPRSSQTPAPPRPSPSARASSPPAASRPEPAQKQARGSLLIRSTPADADVFVDGRPSGKTPAAVRDLPLGSYTIRVSREGYATEQRTIDLTARRPTAATLFELQSAGPRAAIPEGAPAGPAATRMGRLLVQSRPPNARVFVDDRPIGTTPLSLLDVPEGSATVRIELEGYTTWTTRVRVTGGEQTRVTASLERP